MAEEASSKVEAIANHPITLTSSADIATKKDILNVTVPRRNGTNRIITITIIITTTITAHRIRGRRSLRSKESLIRKLKTVSRGSGVPSASPEANARRLGARTLTPTRLKSIEGSNRPPSLNQEPIMG